ncbi:MAG: heparinase II/III family protein [Armatimonadetes bacterium]|nr:heparinase II/III family protein [Armatimonadota bacterium]
MRTITSAVGLVMAGGLGSSALCAPQPPDFSFVLQNIKPTHPRLFLNQEMLQKIKRERLTPDQQRWLDALRSKVDGYPAPPPIDDKLVAHMLSEEGGRRYLPQHPPRVFEGNWGYWSAHAALAYLLTGERRYYDKAVTLLRHAAGIYTVIFEHERIPCGMAFERLSALSCYDWLYNDLPQQEREALGKSLFASMGSFYRWWMGRSYYTDELLGWYLGLVFLGTGVEGADDATCTSLLQREYGRYVDLFRMRSEGPDGIGYFYGAIGYVTQHMNEEVNFLDCWRTAIGGNFLRYFPTRAYLTNYFLWNTIPADPRPLCHGWSDVFHTDNRMDLGHRSYLIRVPDLHADLADGLNLEGLPEIAQFQCPPSYGMFLGTDNWLSCASPLYFSPHRSSDEQVQATLKRLPRARRFPDPVGHIFMNSGWGENDTHALFIAGRQSPLRKHYDENHFTIYKKGFLALDSGARGFSVNRKLGHASDPRHVGIDHEINYYYDTIAHNCVLIQMKGETLPGYWGQESECNTGGMNKNFGAQVKAFETNDRYTYIASDATGCYNEAKAQEVVRQFLFVYPDYFVVFDRVTSRTPQQKKTWLLHTQCEPQVQGETLSAEQGGGKVFVRTLLPQAARFENVGGPGKEFWAGGKNWPVREDWQHLTPDQHLFGCWRMEVSSAEESQKGLFLHLIQVGDRQELKEMTRSRRIEEGQEAGVEFQAGKATVRVLFSREGAVGGHIRLAEGDKVLVDWPLTQEIMPQAGLAFTEK